MKIGDNVTYLPKNEKGIIKKIINDYAWVVYKCDNKWERYFDYTGAKTKLNELILGWIE